MCYQLIELTKAYMLAHTKHFNVFCFIFSIRISGLTLVLEIIYAQAV